MIKSLVPHALRVLAERQLLITFIDVGARNGTLELKDIAPFVELHGFEPNPTEYEKLLTGKTDHFIAHGTGPPPFRKLSYWPYALADFSGRHEFFLTPSPGASGMLEPNVERLAEFAWEGSYRKQSASQMFTGSKKIEVDVRTLDEFVSEQGLGSLDYLKIDVEGSEYEVLRGGRGILPHTGVIRVETCFIPARKGQKLFSHVDLFLREFGFDLLRYEICPEQVGYKERSCPIEFLPPTGRFPDPYGQPFCCDAIYVNREIADPDRALAQSIVLMERNYLDEALHIVKAKTTLRDPELLELLRTAQNGGVGQRVRMAGYRMIDAIVNTSARLAYASRRAIMGQGRRGRTP